LPFRGRCKSDGHLVYAPDKKALLELQEAHRWDCHYPDGSSWEEVEISDSLFKSIQLRLKMDKSGTYRQLKAVHYLPSRHTLPLDGTIISEDEIKKEFTSGDLGGYESFNLFHLWFSLSRPVEGNLYSFMGNRTKFCVHQFKPLLRFLSQYSDERLYIADEVGVGKTIETGIIVKELLARGRLDYLSPILIVCPSSLVPKWFEEMTSKFSLYFHMHDSTSLKSMLETGVKTGSFPPEYIFSIVGLQLLRREEEKLGEEPAPLNMLRQLDCKSEKPIFELVIIDEAHHMRNPSTLNNETGKLLNSMTEMMLLLSATPMNLSNADLYNQMHILNPAAFPDEITFSALQDTIRKLNKIVNLVSQREATSQKEILLTLERLRNDQLGRVIFSHPNVQKFVERLQLSSPFSVEEVAKYRHLFTTLSPLFHSFTRTMRREAWEHQVIRDAHRIAIHLSPGETAFSNEVLESIKAYYRSKNVSYHALGLIMNIYRRMVSSCIPATVQYLQESLIENKHVDWEIQGEEEPEDDSEDQVRKSRLDRDLRTVFQGLVAKAAETGHIDSKYAQFRELVERILENPETPQVIVFSFFVRTLEYLRGHLEQDGFQVDAIHGKVPLLSKGGVRGRDQIMEEFKKGEYNILLSSEVGGEGLDFQFCHAIINYDLPYNPMRIEQRIGRIDRFGQKAEKVTIANLFITRTVDEEIYTRLYERIRLIEDGIGALEPILGDELSKFQISLVMGDLTEEEKEVKQKRLDYQIREARRMMEEFENSRKELLSDDFLMTSLNLPKETFFSPESARDFTEKCLSRWKGCGFERIGENYGKITLSKVMMSELARYLNRAGCEGGYYEVADFFESLFRNGSSLVVFDGSQSENLQDYCFLSPTGYWSLFLLHKLKQEKEVRSTFSFQLTSNIGLPQGEYVLFLFQVRITGLRSTIELIGIPVEIEKKTVETTDFGNLAKNLTKANDCCRDINPPSLELDSLLKVAKEYVGNILAEKAKAISEDNLYMIDFNIEKAKLKNQIELRALEQRHLRYMDRIRKERKQPSEFYIRMIKGKMDKENKVLLSRIDDLQKRKGLTSESSLVAIVYLKIVNNEDCLTQH